MFFKYTAHSLYCEGFGVFLYFVFRFLLQLVNNLWGWPSPLTQQWPFPSLTQKHNKTGKSPTKCSIAWKMCFRFKDHVVIIWCIPGTTWSHNNSNNWLLDFFQSSTTMMFELISNYRHKNAQRLFRRSIWSFSQQKLLDGKTLILECYGDKNHVLCY